MNEFEEMLDYVKNKLVGAKSQGGASKTTINYDRFEHIKRVYAWMQNILTELSPEIWVNERVLRTATIFHDAGYGVYTDNKLHAEASTEICKNYLVEMGYEDKFIEEVTLLVANHSQKQFLIQNNTSIELIILMEADLLDDTGAMGIIMDSMVQARREHLDFRKVYEHIVAHTCKAMKEDPMVTEPAKRFWKEKQWLAFEFVRQLERDLHMN